MARINFRIGYGNAYGPYSESSRGGFTRVAAQGKLLESMGCDLFVTLEDHEETYRRKDGTREKAYMPLLRATPSYDIIEGQGGNQLRVRKSAGFELIRKSSVHLPSRSASKWNLSLLDVPFWVFGFHFVAGQTAGRKATRAAQAGAFLAFANFAQRGIMCYDSNDFKKKGTRGTAQTLMTKAGWIDMRDKALQPVANADVDSRHGHDTGPIRHEDTPTWIENIRTRAGVRVLTGGLVPTGKLSDHNWLWADVEIDSEVLLGKNDRPRTVR